MLGLDGNLSWSDWSQIGIDALSFGLTQMKNPYAIGIGLGISIADELGAFDSYYDSWGDAQFLYENAGSTILPMNYPGSQVPIIINGGN